MLQIQRDGRKGSLSGAQKGEKSERKGAALMSSKSLVGDRASRSAPRREGATSLRGKRARR